MAYFVASIGLLLFLFCLSGCSSSIYGWQVRTNSLPVPPSLNLVALEQDRIALLPAWAPPFLRGTEVGLAYYFGDILHKVVPHWNVIPTG